ncbi:MAG: response regulator [Bacteroidota bacterium]
MNKFLLTYILLSLITLNFVVAQENPVSKKEIQNKIIKAREELTNLDCEKSLGLAQEALSQAYTINDNLLIAKAYNVIGSNFLEFADTQKAKSYYLKALNYANKTDNDTIKDWVYNNLGAVYAYYENDFEKGIEFYKKGLIYTEKTNNPIQITYNSLNISGAYFDEGLFEKGLPFLKKAEKYLPRHDEIEARITLYSQLATYYSVLKQNEKAELNYEKAIQFGENDKTNLVDSYLAEVYNDFSTHYFKNKNYQKAYHYLDRYNKIKNKIYNDERSEKVRTYENKLEIDEYKRQIDFIEKEKLEKERSLQKTKIIGVLLFVILSILSVLTYTLFKTNKIKKKNFEELQRANFELNKAKEIAEESTQLKSQFVSTITHELRTPLYGVVGITDIIANEHPELKDSEHLNSLKFSAKYLLSLVNDVLQIYKISEKKIILENTKFNIREKLESIKNSLQILSVKNNNQIVLEISDDIPKLIIGDSLRLSQIFMNLINNSLKFTENGKIIVRANLQKKEGNFSLIKFQVEDNGIGISKEDHEKVFKEFVQIERREDDYQGTGLGLPIVKKLVELFGGEVTLESEEKVGTIVSFTIEFETIDENLVGENIPLYKKQLPDREIKILLVEDNKINQVVTEKLLNNFNFKTVVVEDGYKAVEKVKAENFDLILMDINMPKINGFETTKLIRTMGVETPIIALTAFDKQEVEDQALESGMNGTIIKPFEKDDLYDLILKFVME